MPQLKLPLVLFQKSFNYGLILTFFGFTKWGGGFCVGGGLRQESVMALGADFDPEMCV